MKTVPDLRKLIDGHGDRLGANESLDLGEWQNR